MFTFLKFNQSLMRFSFFLLFFIFSYLGFAQNNPYQSILLDKQLLENATSVLRMDAMTIKLHSSTSMTIAAKQVITVLSKAGNDHVRTSIGYDNETKIKNIEIIIYDALGNPLDHIKKKDFKDRSAVDGFSLYLDSRILYYNYTPVQYPYTLEFSYEVETADTGIIPSWYFLGDYSESVENSRWEIVYDSPDLKPIILEKNLAGLNISKKENNNSIVYTANNIPAVKYEGLSPSFSKMAPQLRTRIRNFHYKGYDGSVDNWSELGSWVNDNMLVNRNRLEESTIAKARDLVRGTENDLEKAKIIYKYVQENTRYVSVQIGIGGFQPISAIDVDRVKYGDCKGLSNYTKALLEAVGVTSYYVVVEAGRDKVDFEDDFADLAQGNHIILAIPYEKKYYWIDCTSQTLPFGYIGSFTDDRKVLVVKPNGGEIATTAAYLGKENYQRTQAVYSLNGDGDISGSAIVESQGEQYNNHFYLQQGTKEEVEKYYKSYWSQINNLTVEDYQFTNDREQVSFVEKVTLNASNYASISGDRILFRPNSLDASEYVPNKYRNRKTSFEIQRGYLNEDEYTIDLPKDYVIEAMPEETLVENEFGYYKVQMEYLPIENQLRYNRSFLLKNGVYTKEQYELYREFRKKISNTDSAHVVLVKKNI